jgi:NifU-like protein involved in Fe-S cluster formation
MANLLWKEETLDLLKKNQALKGIKSKPKRILCERLTVICSKQELNDYLRNRIISYRYKQ